MIVDTVLENIKEYNSWRLVDLITTNVDTKDEETLYETMLHGIEARINYKFLIGTFGAMIINEEATQGYYLVKWITEPHTVQENRVMNGVEIICDAVFWKPVPNAIDWYIPMSKKEGLVMIRLKQVLITGVTIMEISEINMLPSKCNKKQASNQGAMKIDDDDVCELI